MTQNQPPPPGQPLPILDFLDRLHAAGYRLAPRSLRWVEGPKGKWRVEVGIVEDRSKEVKDGIEQST